MDPGLAILLVVLLLWVTLAVLYFVRVPPFNATYLAPNPRTWEVESEEQQNTSEINYEPFLYDQPQQPADQIYSHFIEYYCSEENIPKLGPLYEEKYCVPYPLNLWISFGDDPIPAPSQNNSGQITIPEPLFTARPLMISRSTTSFQRGSRLRRARGGN